MAGYIGSKAVTLSTTAADVAGNAVIDGDLTVKGTTVTIDSAAVQEIKLGDNDKLTFGDATGGDLQIYHDGSNSYIEDAGTGWLLLKGNDSGVAAQDGSGNYVWYANQNGFGAYYNNSVKLATTSTGVDITGTLTSDGLTVDGGSVNNDSNAIAAKINANGNEHIRLEISTNSTIGNQAALDLISNSNTSRIYTTGTSGLTFSTDGGSTAHLTVDGSGNVGIGGAASSFGSGVATLQLKGLASGKTAAVTFRDNGGTDVASIFAQNDATYGLSIGTLGATGDFVRFHTGALGTERMRIDSSGNLLVGTTDTQPPTNNDASGIALRTDGKVAASRSNGISGDFNNGSTGDIVWLRRAGTTRGILGTGSTSFQVAANAVSGTYNMLQLGASAQNQQTYYLQWDAHNGEFYSLSDNAHDLGAPTLRWDDVYATNGTIQTSDQNEKQQIASLTDAEMTAAKAISKLFKTFKWNDSVAEKGDAARTHTGVIAQEVEQAMTDAGLNAGDYAFFISTTWWETQTEVPAVEAIEAVEATYDEEGNVLTEAVEAVEAQEAYTRTDTYRTAEEAPDGATERNRKGIRYPQLLSFIGAATEQRLASIESRLDALEGN